MGVRLFKRKSVGGKTWLYLHITSNGRRRKESLGLCLGGDRLQDRETLKRANEIRTRRELQLVQQRHGTLHSITSKEGCLAYLENLASQSASPHTRNSWMNAIRHFNRFVGDDISFAALHPQLMEGFRDHLLGEVSRNSAQIYFSRIKTGFYRAVRDGKLASNPAQGISIRKEEKLPVHLTFEEVQRLADSPCPNEHVKSAFLFACFTGLRYSDVAGLKWDQIQDGNVELTQKKTGAPIRLPLSSQASQILNRQRNSRPSSRLTATERAELVFVLPRQSTVDKEIKTWGKTAGLQKQISMHKARHTFATLSLSSGNDIYTTSKLLGHKNLQTTQIYAKVIDESLQRAVARLPNLKVGHESKET